MITEIAQITNGSVRHGNRKENLRAPFANMSANGLTYLSGEALVLMYVYTWSELWMECGSDL